jgi:hypothetical protein
LKIAGFRAPIAVPIADCDCRIAIADWLADCRVRISGQSTILILNRQSALQSAIGIAIGNYNRQSAICTAIGTLQ